MNEHSIAILVDTLTPEALKDDEVTNALIEQWICEFTNLACSLHLIPSTGEIAVSLTMNRAGDVVLMIDNNGDDPLRNLITSVRITFPGQRVLDSIDRMVTCIEHEDTEEGTSE